MIPRFSPMVTACVRSLAATIPAAFPGPPGHFVEILNQQLTGRFGRNPYASLLWAEYNGHTGVLTYIKRAICRRFRVSPPARSKGWIQSVFSSECSQMHDIPLNAADAAGKPASNLH
jgi:hypothetical protein